MVGQGAMGKIVLFKLESQRKETSKTLHDNYVEVFKLIQQSQTCIIIQMDLKANVSSRRVVNSASKLQTSLTGNIMGMYIAVTVPYINNECLDNCSTLLVIIIMHRRYCAQAFNI